MQRSLILIKLIMLFLPLNLAAKTPFVPDVPHQAFRDEVVQMVKATAAEQINQIPDNKLNKLEKAWDNHYQRTNWLVTIDIYHHGDMVGKAQTNGRDLTKTLKKATVMALDSSTMPDNAHVEDYRFKISFDYPPSDRYSIMSYNGKGLEAVGARIAVRKVNADSLRQQIKASKGYLLRQQNMDYHAFFKFYNADKDKAQTLLRTTYTASSLYSLIKLNQLQPDPAIKKQFPAIAGFLLDRQLTSGPQAGGFDYGYYPDTQQGTCRVVVGTTSKTIYTLLLMDELYPDNKQYLNAAMAAGNWLLKMVKDNGNVIPVAKCDDGDWHYRDKQSFLYTGETLSALSRLYATTQQPRYLDGARKIAAVILNAVKQQGPLLADDYRPANSISSSWAMMSLMDLARVDPQPVYLQTIETIANTLLLRQIDNPQDVFSHGRYLDAMTTSGNGWINEVMGEWVGFCRQNQLADCESYQDAMRRTSRWLIQNAFNAANSYDIANPARAEGGFITNFNTLTVRTDAVCHGLNGLISLLRMEANNDEMLVTLTEEPLREILPLLRAGR